MHQKYTLENYIKIDQELYLKYSPFQLRRIWSFKKSYKKILNKNCELQSILYRDFVNLIGLKENNFSFYINLSIIINIKRFYSVFTSVF